MSRVPFRRSYLKVLAVEGAIVRIEDMWLSDLVGALLCGMVMVRRRGRSRKDLNAADLVTQPMQDGSKERIGV